MHESLLYFFICVLNAVLPYVVCYSDERHMNIQKKKDDDDDEDLNDTNYDEVH